MKTKLRYILLPFTLLYSAVLFVRHKLFDLGILKSTQPQVKTLVIGNLALGGTGKTPHTELLIERLKSENKIAILSRGYGRKTKGFILADNHSRPDIIGDEPHQIHKKFPKTPLAVCEDRVVGIKKLTELFKDLDLIILDDAFQHRRLSPHSSLLLTTYQNPFFDDILLPAGNLRDIKSRKKAADYIIVSKCPEDLSTNIMSDFRAEIKPSRNQKLFFSSIEYGSPLNFEGGDIPKECGVILVSGIAKPESFYSYCKSKFEVLEILEYVDHYDFLGKDLKAMENKLIKFANKNTVILCTEKDFYKLSSLFSESKFKQSLYFLPMRAHILEQEEDFINSIKNSIQ